MMSDDLNWQRLGSRYAQPQLPLFRTRLDEMQNPRSGRSMERLVLESVDWVNLVAIDAVGRAVMIRQYRFGVGYTTLETPGGMVDPGEAPAAAARRELLEETGYGGGRWQYLGAVEPNPAIHDHLCHHFLAEDVTPQAPPQPGTGEAIQVSLLRTEEVIAAVHNGEIRHALALSALARVYPLWPQPFAQGPVLSRRRPWQGQGA